MIKTKIVGLKSQASAWLDQLPTLLKVCGKGTLALFAGFIILLAAQKTGWFEPRKAGEALFYAYVGFLGGGLYGVRQAWLKLYATWEFSFVQRSAFIFGYATGFVFSVALWFIGGGPK